jgi:predicted Zn-dependent protease
LIGHTVKKVALSALASLLVTASGAVADDIKLPDMGSPADAVLSKSEEAQIGRAIMAQIRLTGAVVEDPLVTEYINEVGSRIAAQTNDGSQSFKFFVIEDPNINAFALPGGFIGVHTGLLDATRNEDELAGVLAHEVAHVTQRHIARAIHASQRQSIMSTAIMLGAILAGVVSGDSDVAQAGMVVAQGSAAQQQINFTRSNEYEADRIGISAMADAGFDPHGMASFFEVMSRQSPADLDMRMPEFLRTHPVTTQRIAEAKNRAREYPRQPNNDTVNYGIARVRMKVESFDTDEAAVTYYESRDYEKQNDIEKYGRAVAYQRAGRHRDANRIFEELLQRNPNIIAYHIGTGETQLALEQNDRGIETFERAVSLFPRNVPLVIHYGEGLLKLGQANKAHKILLDLMNNVPPTPEQVRLIAKAAIEAGEIAEAHYYMAEYRFMIGDMVGGVNFLRQALQVPELNEIQRIRFEARIDFIQEFMTEEQLQRLRRSGAPG